MEQTENEQKALFDFDDLLSEETSGRVNIKKNLPKRIATVLDSERSSGLYLQFMRGQISEAEFDEGLDDCVIEYGMTKEEIERYFPPALRHKNRLSFNRTSVIASIKSKWQLVESSIFNYARKIASYLGAMQK